LSPPTACPGSDLTGDPGLEFDGFNVFRAEAGDKTGIEDVRKRWERSRRSTSSPTAPFIAYTSLSNGGSRDVRITAVPKTPFHYWALAGAAVSTNDTTAFIGEDYVPLRPFTLRRGETRYLRLDFVFAGCSSVDEDMFSSIDSSRVK
jgi:hypothetical protein